MGGKPKLTISEVKDKYLAAGFILLEDCYINNRTSLLCVCEKGHETKKALTNLKTGCIVCGRKKTEDFHRLSYSEVYDYFNKNRCELLSKEYVNAKGLLDYKCECGSVGKISYDNFKQGKRCNICRYNKIADKRKHEYAFVMEFFEQNGCTLLSRTYSNHNQLLDYICECGRASQISFSNFQQGQRCRVCFIERNSGENSHLFKPYLTSEHREKGRNFKDLRDWRKAVFERDNYTCVVCNKKGVYLNAHHINGYDLFPELRDEVSNGTTLCRECHTDFHKKYGYGRNTKTQFSKWLSRKNGIVREVETGEAVANQFDF
jgi:hypothetical protein